MKSIKFIFVLLVSFSSLLFAQSKDDEAYSLFSKGNEYFNAKNYDNAIVYHKKALEIYKQIYGETSLYVADSYFNIGNAYLGKKDVKTAIIYHKNALKIYEQKEGFYHSDTASTYNSMGWDYLEIADYKNARWCY